MDEVRRFDRLWKESERTVVRLLRRIAPPSERADLLLETRLSCWRSFSSFQGEQEEFFAFASHVATIETARVRRTSPGGERATFKPVTVVLRDHYRDEAEGPLDLALASVQAARLGKAFNRLPDRWREVMTLLVRGETHRSIAATCGVSKARATQLIEQARACLLSATS